MPSLTGLSLTGLSVAAATAIPLLTGLPVLRNRQPSAAQQSQVPTQIMSSSAPRYPPSPLEGEGSGVRGRTRPVRERGLGVRGLHQPCHAVPDPVRYRV